ncbi:MAG: undecaprenyl-diphosphate phosphatase [Candidatus Riflebacteria bacterium]|nr:undecaprenyl-diphosphate phosphatase [Candidatus Riflebacteria bacterium]
MNNYIAAIIQGIVEGLTEFLPVSSTGHMILVARLISFETDAAKVFEIFIQLGAILAVAIYYRDRIASILKNWKASPFSAEKRLTLWHILAGMLPALVLGFLLHKTIKTRLFSPETVIIGLVIGGIFMIFAERKQGEVKIKDIDDLSLSDCVKIGFFQCLALWPGFSRSGATIAGGLLLGASHRSAADFSFILAIPMMAAATAYDLLKSHSALSASDAGYFATGFFTAFVVAWFAVVYFLKFLDRLKLTPFAWYRFTLAAFSAIVLYAYGK